MNITVQSDRLAAALKHGVASARSPLPILQHARLHVRGNTLHVDTTDTEAWVSARLPVDQAHADFDIALRDDLLRPVAAPGAGAITINADGKIKSGRGRYTVPAAAVDDFPQVDDIDWQSLVIDAAALAGAIDAAGYAADEGEIRQYLKAVQVVPGLCWSADNAQIAVMALDYAGPRLAIPPRHIPRVMAALAQDSVTLSVGNVRGDAAGMLRITGDAMQLSLRLLDTSAMDMAGYLGRVTIGEGGIHLSTTDLTQALRRFLPFAQHGITSTKHGLPEVQLRRDGSTLTLLDRAEQFSEVITTELEGEPEAWSMACDIKRLLSMLGACGGGSVVVHPHATANGNHSLVIVPAGLNYRQAVHMLALITK